MSVYQRVCPADGSVVVSCLPIAPFPRTRTSFRGSRRPLSALVSSALTAVSLPVTGRLEGIVRSGDQEKQRAISACSSPEETHEAFESVFQDTMQRYLEER